MNFCIIGKEKLPSHLKHLAIGGEKVLVVFDENGLVKKVVSDTVRVLNSKMESMGGTLSPVPSQLDFANIKAGAEKNIMNVSSKSEVVKSLKSMVGGNFSGIRNFNLEDFWHHVQASAARTIQKNKSAAVQASRLRIGQIALDKIVNHVISSVQGGMPGIKIPFIGEKKIINLDKYREIIAIVIGNASLLGFDIFSYFKIPMTGLAEVTANCMVEYAYDLGSKKIVEWIPQTKIVTGITSIFSDAEKEIGTQNLEAVMTDSEKAAMNNGTQSELAAIIEQEKILAGSAKKDCKDNSDEYFEGPSHKIDE